MDTHYSLNRKYLELQEEYKSLRRNCEKPADMLEQIINASSRPGEVVADFFMGPGSTIKAAIKLGRSAIGVELEEERFRQTISELKQLIE